MFEGQIYGVTNGVITILSLITGSRATNVNKIGIIGALCAMMIADPLSDSYSIYVAEKHSKKKTAYLSSKNAFFYQFLLQFIFFIIILVTKDIDRGILYTYIFGIIVTIVFGKYLNINNINIIKNLLSIFVIVVITYFFDSSVCKYEKFFNN